MWSNNRPPPTNSAGDHYNNNSTTNNPYSRNASISKEKPGRQSTDPWNWGWEDTSAQHDDWNSAWNQPIASVPNVIPNPSPSLCRVANMDKNPHGTPDLIPEKINSEVRGGVVERGQQHYNQVSNASDFFENIDLVGHKNQPTPPPPMYGVPEARQSTQQPCLPNNFPMYQPSYPHNNAVRQHITPAAYFSSPTSTQLVANQQNSFYQHPSPSYHPAMFQQSQFSNNQVSAQEQSNNYYIQNNVPPQEQNIFFDKNCMGVNKNETCDTTNLNFNNEVENVEVPVAPPERAVSPVCLTDLSNTFTQTLESDQNTTSTLPIADESSIPDNQETVPENEEKIQNLPKKLSQMKISNQKPETWNSSSGWENQEVAPRCELDRNQYLETGQLLDSAELDEIQPEIDNNDEVEALPPPGLDRMVTGQGVESISQRSVLGHTFSMSQSSGNGFVRLVQGQPILSISPDPSSLERLVPGQQNIDDSINWSIPGQQSQSSLLQRFPIQQESQGEMQRLVTGQNQSESPVGVRMVPGQLSDDENNLSSSDMERMIPGGVSENDISFSGGMPDDERMVPGGMSDDSRSQSISIDDDTRNSTERMVSGLTEASSLQANNQNERLVTGAGSTEVLESSVQNSSQNGSTLRNGTPESANQPPPALHRLVLGQTNSGASTELDNSMVKPVEKPEEKQGGNPPPGMQRMVVGQFREKEPEPGDHEKETETVKSIDRENDSDSDERSYRRRQRHRRDSYDEDRRERDYSSEREYRGKREERRDYRKKMDNSYNRSPEYRSDHEDYDRNDYRDRRERERDRRDRPRDRERRRRSPEYYYDQYYRDDPRKLHPRDRERRYYDTYEDDYYYRENRSRPSSRSGSEYRRHRDYPPRQQGYYPEPGGMGNYGHYYQMQQYYENMRRNDPQAYALWYERYMAEKFGTASNDRASVHSGRSSANDNSQLQENDEEDGEGIKVDDAVSQRSTPPLFTSAHIRGQFNMLGQLIVVNPHDPFNYGEHQATVTVCKVAGPNAADTADVLEFLQNPGPFVSGVTHKNTVLQYLKKQSDQISHSSGKLLYELIRLVIRLNGVVDMTDVADLLMESYRNNKADLKDFSGSPSVVDETPLLSPQEITSKFRELLLEGNKTEALEWAMKNKDWGHALFLASKMDSRTHNNVMLRFANGLQNNDPLQTLYQLMSGREPQAATCAADKKWGDWRPHLAMMLSNRTANPDLDRKAILTLGDSLGARGRLFASHFCYLTAQLEFSNYSDRHAKLVLLGNSVDQPFGHFATCRAIMLTLSYEYAKQLSNKEWCIQTLRPYKYLLACRLFDHGNLAAALAYLECLAQEIVQMPARDDKPLAQLIVDMADKIKGSDSTLAYTTDPSVDPDWLARLKFHIEETNDPNYLQSHLRHGISTSTVSDLEPFSTGELAPQIAVQETLSTHQTEVTGYTTDSHTNGYAQESYYDPSQNNYYNQQPSVQSEDHQPTGYNVDQHTAANNPSLDYWSNNSGPAWDQQAQLQFDSTTQQQPAEPVLTDTQPQVSVKPGFGYFASSEEDSKPQVENKSTSSAAPEKSESREKTNRRSNKTQQSGPGWFGGIWDKLALRPKNQMNLPDDKNPSIVWDEKAKKWVNTDASEEEQNAQLKPPPKASVVNNNAVPSAPAVTASSVAAPSMTAPTGLPPTPATAAKGYKLQRGKGMRANYVDVMGNNKMASSNNASQPQPFPSMPQPQVTNFFIPAPVAGNENAPIDFVSPSGPVSYEPSSSKSNDQPPPVSSLPHAKSGALKLLDFGWVR